MIKTIYVDFKDENSISKAEVKKQELENNDYVLIGEDIGFLTARFIYRKD